MSAFQSEGRWAPHTTRSWRFLGFEEGLDRRPPDDGGDQWLLPSSLDKASEDIIVGILDSGERPRASCTVFVVSCFVHLHATYVIAHVR